MFSYQQKRELIKNTIFLGLILVIAIVSTHHIYYSFQDTRKIKYNSESLEVIYREKEGDKIRINKITPVTDSVGLSSKAYILSIKNNLTEKVPYKIKIEDDNEELDEEEIIPREDIRISIKAGRINRVYDLDKLEEGILLEDNLEALETKNISIRTWIRQDSNLPSNSDLTYNGKIQVIEDDNSLALLSRKEN